MTEPHNLDVDAISRALDGLVRTGEVCVVRGTPEGVVVQTLSEGPATEALRREHPELLGALLSANERISSAGGCLMMSMVLAGALAVSLAIHAGFLEPVLGAAASARLQGWLTYTLVGILAVAAIAWLMPALERRAYYGCRDEVLSQLGRTRLSPSALLAVIEGEDALGSVAEWIKKDPDLAAGTPVPPGSEPLPFPSELE